MIINLKQITKIVIVLLLILSGCSYDTEKKLCNSLTVTDCFTHEEIKDLAKLLDFFNEQICVSSGMNKKEIIKCYDSFIERMWKETVEIGGVELKIPYFKQQEVYNQISDSLFNQIWIFIKNRKRNETGTLDTLRTIEYRIDGKYVKFLKELGKEYELAKNYSETLEIFYNISPSMYSDIFVIKEYYQYDLNDIRLQLVLAIHYLTMNDQYQRKEKFYHW